MIVVVCGLPGSGKSFFASQLAARIKADHISSDRIRRKILPERTYSLEEKLVVYDEMLKEMKNALRHNKHLVLDATFYKDNIRKKIIDEAGEAGTIFFIEVVAKEALMRKRLKKHREDSEADFEIYKMIKDQWEPMLDPHLVLQSTDDNLDEMMEKAIIYLQLSHT